MKVYKKLAFMISGNEIEEDKIEAMVKDYLPSGSGINNGVKMDLTKSNSEKLVFSLDYQHMSEHGFYVGWTHHNVIVTPSLRSEIEVKVTGRDRDRIKEYLGELFHEALDAEISLRSQIDVRQLGADGLAMLDDID